MKLSIKSKRYPAKNCHKATIAHFGDLCQKIIQDESGKQTKTNFQKQALLNIDSNVQIFIGDVNNVQFTKSYFLAIPGQRLQKTNTHTDPGVVILHKLLIDNTQQCIPDANCKYLKLKLMYNDASKNCEIVVSFF